MIERSLNLSNGFVNCGEVVSYFGKLNFRQAFKWSILEPVDDFLWYSFGFCEEISEGREDVGEIVNEINRILKFKFSRSNWISWKEFWKKN